MKNSVKQVAFGALALLGFSLQAKAYITQGEARRSTVKSLLKTTANCKPATAAIDLDINNVRARLMTGGDMWRDLGTELAGYEVPKGGKKHSLYAGSCWIGGQDASTKALKVAGQRYRSDGNDYWPGPVDKNTQSITEASCSEWDKFWKVNASVVADFRDIITAGGATDPALSDSRYDVIKQWPAAGNIDAVGALGNALPELLMPGLPQDAYAPFIDVNGDKLYNWKDGDYPRAYGVEGSNPTQFIWWVFNDVGNAKLTTKSQSINVEVQTSAFAYTGTDFRNDATFYNYRLINRGTTILDSCFIATWTDADLGNPFDDYIGCDTARGLGILYNAEPVDRPNGENSYGSRLPMVGVDFFIGPRKTYINPVTGLQEDSLLKMSSFSYFENSISSPVRDPNSAASFYNYMTGSTYTGLRFSDDKSRGTASVGYGEGIATPFVFYGDPSVSGEWSQCFCKNPPADRRFIHSSGPFRLEVGAVNDITIGVVWVDNVGGCGSGASFKKIRAADDIAQSLFDNGFKGEYGPEAPDLTIRELDKKLILYITNPANSNNYNERFGDPRFIDNPKFKQISSKAKGLKLADSIYRFEGYRVFQLRKANSSVYDENGNLTADAVQVFQTDVKNGVKQITNYSKNLEVTNPIDQYNASIKVNGKDSGIVHSFVLTEDAFASGTNKSMSNYKTYYYKIIAYSYNNFANFDPANEVGTQNSAYLEGNNGPNTSAIKVYAAMPNPMNQNGDTFSTVSAYGQGVVITRIEGTGNGGLDVQMDAASEDSAVMYGQVIQPKYLVGKGPVGIKVIDPVKVVDATWRISFSGPIKEDSTLGLVDTATWKIEQLDASGNVTDVIVSSQGLSTPNEEILAKYGLSVTAGQVLLPGAQDSNVVDNGYITSDVTFADKNTTWLAGVRDLSGRSLQNWIRSGSFKDEIKTGETAPPCAPFSDYSTDSNNIYGNMMANNTLTTATWAPYDVTATIDGISCGFGPAKISTVASSFYIPPAKPGEPVKAVRQSEMPNVDLVFTSDKSKWTRCLVLETGDDPLLSEGGARKLMPRSHASWGFDMQIDDAGNPVYSTTAKDTGFSWFPGYAVNQITGERLNIVFGEDSYLRKFNGADMLWNPTADYYTAFGETIFGGRHFTYILNTKYDSCRSFLTGIRATSPYTFTPAYRQIRWVGIPMLNTDFNLTSLSAGLIPTETRLRFRVNTPYRQYKLLGDQVAINDRKPLYTFSTKGMAPSDYTQHTDADALMDKIVAVPNPYKGVALGGNSYETNRLETKIKIINLPVKASIDIYSLDGTMVRHLEKDNNDPALSWDLYNSAGLPIASGMYLIHVKAYNKDKVIRWFGAMRPLDVTNY